MNITRELIRKRAEHNEGMISTLEELTLHQEELTCIDECLGQSCRSLKILLLQNNIINKMENLHHMKTLEYLNLALNNISKIEGLDRCEFLNKLDLTINFIDVDVLEESIDNLVDRDHLKDLYMMGNPAEQDWKGFGPYVIARLPQLKALDGTEITRSMRITAQQQLPALVFELRQLAESCKVKKKAEAEEAAAEKKVKDEAAAEKKRLKDERKRHKEEAMEVGVVQEVGDSSSDEDDGVSDPNELTAHTPEVRTEMYKEMAEQKMEKEKREKENQPNYRTEKDFAEEQKASIEKAREREERGEIRQCNEGKWKFNFSEEQKGYVVLDVHVQKHLSSSLIDVDCHPDYISVVIKSKVLRLALPCEVYADDAKAQRSATTGHLVVTMKKLDPNENMIALRAAQKHAAAKVEEERKKKEAERAAKENSKTGNQLLAAGMESVRLDGIVKRSAGGVGKVQEAGFGMTAVETTILKAPEATEQVSAAVEKKIQIAADDSDDDDDDGDEPPPIM
jgi:protein TilB